MTRPSALTARASPVAGLAELSLTWTLAFHVPPLVRLTPAVVAAPARHVARGAASPRPMYDPLAFRVHRDYA